MRGVMGKTATWVRSYMAFFLVLLLVSADAFLLLEAGLWRATTAFAAQVQIDATVSTALTEHIITGHATVFISDQVGYKFYVDSDGRCRYAKTTDGGVGWGTPVLFDTQTDCASPVVWYDQWTPGDTGSFIHIVTMDPGDDDLWYNRLDTSSDTLLLGSTPVNVTVGQSYVGTLDAGTNKQAMTKGTDGTLYAGISDGPSSIIVECTSNCNIAGNWSVMGTPPLDNQNDYILMLPLAGGDIMLLRRDISLEDIQYQIWNNVSWPGVAGWSTIDSAAFDNTTYDSMMAAVVNDDFEIFLAYLDAPNYTTSGVHDLRTAKYSSGNWTNTNNVVTNFSGGLTNVSVALDVNSDDVYVAYSARTTIGTAATGNVYWATSTSAMSSWSGIFGPVNTTPENIAGVDLNHRSDERIYVSWYGETSDDMFGDTLADVSPQTRVSATGAMQASVRASSSPTHLGGTFVVQEFQASRLVTRITLSETGTVDGAVGIGDVALYYDLDTTAPYNCVSESFVGTESQFGLTDTNGFSGADGIAIFSDAVTISPTQALCVYPVLQVRKAAQDGTTIALSIANPATDVTLSAGVPPVPSATVALAGSTTIIDDELTQTGFHFRNDNGSETAATSRTGGIENTNLSAQQKEVPVRLRFGVANLGSTSTFPISLRLEYATTAAVCTDSLGWSDVGSVVGDWNMFDSTFLAEGANTTDIATSTGGVSNGNSVFLTPNGGVRDVSSVVAALTFSPTNFTEVEFSITSSSTAQEGQTYCFRLSNNGESLSAYATYPRITLSSDVTVRATGTPVSSVTIPTTDVYTGDTFSIVESTATRTVTSIVLTELGVVDASTGVANVRLYYDLDTTFPYDCGDESFGGGELQFGATSTTGFSAANGTVQFTDSVLISPIQALCLYPVLDVTAAAQNGESIDLSIVSPPTDIVVTGGASIGPAIPVSTPGSTALVGGVLRQFGYHWRADDGSEVAAASLAGTENTPLTEFTLSTPVRLRFLVDNVGPVTSVPTSLRLEYGIRLTSCDNVSVWTDVGVTPDAWDMFDSSNLTHGADTTDVSSASGGVTNPVGKIFLTPNAGVRDTDSVSAPITLGTTDFVEIEYSITSTASTSYATNYCFRVTNDGVILPEYNQYAELTTVARRDFRVQRGTTIMSGSAPVTVVPGPTTYTAPASTSLAFVRITNMHHTGAGHTVGDNTQESDDVTAYISNSSNLATGFTLFRYGPTNNNVVSWEIVEFIGELGTDNEMRVRAVGTTTLTGANQVATGTVVTGVTDDADVVVFITGSANANTGSTAYFNSQVTSRWDATTQRPVFERIGSGSTAAVSYAVVEFTGINWRIQRAEHIYTSATTTQTQSIAPVNSLSRTFLHTQKRMGALSTQANFGHQVWLSSIGEVSFRLSPTATTTNGQVSVAWVIENTQTSVGKMLVQRLAGSITGGAEPRTTTIGISPIAAVNNASIFALSAFEETTSNYPRVLGSVRLASTTAFTIFSGEINNTIPYFYRAEVVEWPTTGLAVRQNYYRFYVDNNLLTPTDPWPPGPNDVGENTSITALDEPVAEGDKVRVRIALTVDNANLAAGLRTYKLQYGLRGSTCSAVEVWTDVGASDSGEIWRGATLSVGNGTVLSGNPPTSGDLLLSVSDVAGRLVTESPSLANPYDALENDDIEYDFVIQHNGAAGSSFYCFRLVNSDGELLDGYVQYPQLRTAGFTPVISRWRWYGDPLSVTPAAALAGEQVTPIDIGHATSVALRVSVAELKNVDGLNAKFRVQYSEYPDFRIAYEVAPSSTCQYGDVWCYAESGGVNNSLIDFAVLSDTDVCVSGVGEGCGTYNEDGLFVTGDTHSGGATREYQFTLQTAGIRTNATYYFRLYDVTNNLPLVATTTYPSVSTEGAVLTFQVDGIAASTTVAGQVTVATTSATAVAFGSLPLDQSVAVAQRLTVFTNGTEGYQVFMNFDSALVDSYGNEIPSVSGSNNVPVPWVTGCSALQTGCFGYTSTDGTLAGGSTRFALNDAYAGVETGPVEVMASTVPVTFDMAEILFRTQVGFLQPAGEYQATVQYIIVPRF